MPAASLIHLLRERHLSSIRSVQPASRWKILVVDSFTKQLLSSVLKMYDVLQQNVSLVESIEHKRDPQPGFEAAYLLTPTSQNVDRIIKDLNPNQQQPQYAAGHIFFVDALSEPLLQRLTSSPAEPKLRQLIELFVNIWPLEAQVFSLKSPQSFFTLFQPPGGSFGLSPEEALSAIEDELHFSTQALLNVCVTLNEFPLVRYYNPNHPPLGPLATNSIGAGSASSSGHSSSNDYGGQSARMARLRGGNNGNGVGDNNSRWGGNAASGEHFTKKLAFRVQKALDSYVRDNEPKIDHSRPKPVLFITDRTMDTIAPFLHEFSYQAMVNDLLSLEEEGTKYKYEYRTTEGELEGKEATLSDEDSIWTGIRHLHIAEAIDKLTKDFAQHSGESEGFSNGTSLNDMRDMLASLPHLQEMKDKLSLHLTMAQDCMNRFEKSKLPSQAMVEQNCAVRLTPDGSKPRTLVEEMVPLLDDRNVSPSDKVRIIALYIMYSDGVPDEDRKRLFQHARLSLHEMDIVDNLTHLGARVVKDPSNSGWDNWFKKGGNKRKQPGGENEYELSRYQPLVKLMLEDHFSNRLDQALYPYVSDAPPENQSYGGGPTISGTTQSAAASFMSSAMAATGGRDSPLARVTGSSSSSSNSNAPRPQPSSLRSAKPTWHTKTRERPSVQNSSSSGGFQNNGRSNGSNHSGAGDGKRGRAIVFVAGGMTYSEVRSAYQVSEKWGKDVYIGSSHIFTPDSFLDALKRFGKAGGAGASNAQMNHHQQQQHHHHHGNGRQALPPGASTFSKPDNDSSSLRSRSDAARHANGGGAHHHHQQQNHHHQQQHHQEEQFSQSAYDRRFQTSAPSVQVSSSSNHQQQQPFAPQPQYAAPQGSQNSGLVAPQRPAYQQSGSSNSGISMNTNQSGMDGRSSPSPSNVSKEKKKMKNPFSFKKS